MNTPQASTVLTWTSYKKLSPTALLWGHCYKHSRTQVCFSKCSCRCTPNVLSCAPAAKFAKSCWIYLAFGSCGYIAKKHWADSSACPLSTLPAGLGKLGLETVECSQAGVAQDVCSVWPCQDCVCSLHSIRGWSQTWSLFCPWHAV